MFYPFDPVSVSEGLQTESVAGTAYKCFCVDTCNYNCHAEFSDQTLTHHNSYVLGIRNGSLLGPVFVVNLLGQFDGCKTPASSQDFFHNYVDLIRKKPAAVIVSSNEGSQSTSLA